ncbi:MAG TPA: hypothetical protein DCR95_01740, partial [Desulfobacter sp.]|nr:hypothetical protein [Desulfobacter sp.]
SRISGIFKCPAPPPEPALLGRRSTQAMLAGLEPDLEPDYKGVDFKSLTTNCQTLSGKDFCSAFSNRVT